MNLKDSPAANFIPKDPLDIICMRDTKSTICQYKIIPNRNSFSLIAEFRVKNVFLYVLTPKSDGIPVYQVLKGAR